MTAFETAMIAAVRAAVADPAADVYWRDGSSAYRAATSYGLSYVSRTARGKDVRSLGTVTAGSAPETVRGNRVLVIQVTVDAPSQGAADEAADVVKAGLRSSAAEALFNGANVSAARPGFIRSIPYRDAHGDTRSCAVLEVNFNATRKVVVGRVPILAAAEISGTVDPGARAIGPVLVEV